MNYEEINPLDVDLITRFIFNNVVIVEVSSDYEDSVMVQVSNVNGGKNEEKTFQLEPDEIDVFVATLNLYKNRILQKRPFGRKEK